MNHEVHRQPLDGRGERMWKTGRRASAEVAAIPACRQSLRWTVSAEDISTQAGQLPTLKRHLFHRSAVRLAGCKLLRLRPLAERTAAISTIPPAVFLLLLQLEIFL